MENYEYIMKEVEKRIKTTMIGSLARFEESFGHLWEEPGPDQQHYLEAWEYTRNLILNNGNKQIRSALDSLSAYLHKSYKTKETYYFNKNLRGETNEN